MGATIRAIRGFLPAKVLTNEELAPQVGWTANDIFAKTGIVERHVSGEDECASDLAVAAAGRLFADTGTPRESIDFLVHCTQTPDHILPTTACLMQARLGLDSHCMAFDLNQGCSGYIYSLAVAQGLIAAGLGKRGLVTTADTYTKYIHPNDRSVRTLFGDGASATLLEASAESSLDHFVFGTDGSGGKNLIIPAGGTRLRISPQTGLAATDANGSTRTSENLFMNGQEIFTFTIRKVPALIDGVLKSAGLALGDIDWFVFHQANGFILEHLRRKLGIPSARMMLFLEHTGNTTSSTIPLTLEDAIARGAFQPGQRILLAGFGVGYSWGACLLRWP
jgi:3-oxoacyl-[acyl-carrier-protein] synthase-3